MFPVKQIIRLYCKETETTEYFRNVTNLPDECDQADDHPGEGADLVRGTGGHVTLTMRTRHHHRGLAKLNLMDHGRHGSSDNSRLARRWIVWLT